MDNFLQTDRKVEVPCVFDGNMYRGYRCVVCNALIHDRYLLRISDDTYYHDSCLRCSECGTTLGSQNVCYKKDGRIYCKRDYHSKFCERCARCDRIIDPKTDWVRRAATLVYHLACFSCDVCGRQLSTGESYKLIDNRILCEKHCVDPDIQKEEMNQKAKTKRVRTTFSEEQLKILTANFMLDSNPDGQDLERIANATGLSKRVTQVWFQNSRARQKKHQQQIPGDGSQRKNFNPSLLSGVPSVGSDNGSEMQGDLHSFSTGSDHSEDWSTGEEEHLSTNGLALYMTE